MRLIAVLILALLTLAACAQIPKDPPLSDLEDPFAVALEDWGNFALPTPPWPSHAAPVEASQRIRATLPDGDRVSFLARLSLGRSGARILLLDELGRRAVTVTWTDLGATVDQAAWLPDWVDGRRMLADLVMVYWPQTLVRSGLPATLEVEDAPDARRVTVRDSGATYLLASHPQGSPWTGTATLENRAVGYRLDIQSTLVEGGP